MGRSHAFVGRGEQLAELGEHWRSARAGRGGFVVVSGDAGIGKTSLVEQLVDTIDGDARVAWGTCPGQEGPPLWPWRTVLGDAAFAPRPAPLDAGLNDPAGGTARRLAETFAELRRIAAESPLVVVLDDLHRADPDSVALLRVVAAEARRLPLLVVATVRATEVPADSPLHELLTDLGPATTVIHLRGLGSPAVAQLTTTLTGCTVTPAFSEAVVRRTGGNPFFVRELLRLLVAEGKLDTALAGGELPVPPLVRDVVLRRVGQLPATTRAVLDAAAVLGRPGDVAVVAAAAGLDVGAATAAIHAAEAARLVEVEHGVVRIAHDLVRDALVDDLDPGALRGLHHAAAGALRRLGGPGAPVTEIAVHLCAALPAGNPQEAAAAALAAARESLAVRAPADAAVHAERGIGALGTTAPALRGELLVALGDARTTTGDRPGARRAYAAAAGVARQHGDADMLATAALGFAGVMGSPRTDVARVELLEEAVAALDGRRDAVRARVQARLAHALLFSDQRERCLRLAEDALALARDTGDHGTVIHALYVWNIVYATSANFEARRAAAEELAALGRSSGDDEVEAWALHLHAHHMAEAGDFDAFDADVAACDVLATRTHSATWRWTTLVHQAMRATMQGRFEDAEALGNEAFEVGVRSQHELASASFGAHLIALRSWQGRLEELLPMILTSAGRFTEVPAIIASLPYAHAELGQLAEASASLQRLVAAPERDDLPRRQSWTVAVAMAARAAALTDDREAAAWARRLLEPYAGRHIIGPLADTYFGPASLYLALCAATSGDLASATVELERAVDQAEAARARPVAAWARAELADVLARAGCPDASRVADLRATARADMEALGMHAHLARLDSSPAVAEPNVFRTEGDSWAVTYAGRTVRLRPTKGLQDLHRLLAAPGEELHVLELAGDAPDGRLAVTSRQPVLDDRAKAEYRRRLLALEAEVRDTRAGADLRRAERAEAERDAVLAELAAALGLGGKDRTMTDESERARQAVRARIRYTLDRIGTVHPELRRHLDSAVVTGTFCSYRPEHPTRWVTT